MNPTIGCSGMVFHLRTGKSMSSELPEKLIARADEVLE
ncbi:hypothetical protein CDS [Bradyrhizobium sp.]|nr:hypothetical protein CDS [Bradyrhizobium sp.]CUU17714.1 hypothetical protein CDS [Bradyrhizobium sp.]